MDLNTIGSIATPREPGGPRRLAPRRRLARRRGPGCSPTATDLSRLVDLGGGLGWEPFAVAPDGLSLAATCTIAALDRIELPAAWIAAPLVGQCCRALLGSFKIWNVANRRRQPVHGAAGRADDRAGRRPRRALRDLDSGGRRAVLPVLDFVRGPQETALAPGELLRRIDLPAAALRRRTAFRRCR